ncbi:two-component system sensor histidine kinase NtrB [Treponema pectinovorum]|uniref:two-component system sensor histidine kinase NtrB n=1 Tax=Treponema pectinovorum TaxID=164 RepID=UPI0011CAE785|nr:ATP-binding protein [Treponema pectinovorum]
MQEFSDRVYEKLSKLSASQIEVIFKGLKSQNEVFKSIFQSLSTGLIAVDKTWKVRQINKAAERLLPLKFLPEEEKNENKKFYDFIDDDEIALFFRDCAEKNKTNISEEYTLSTAAGTIRFIEVSVTPLVEDDEITGNIIWVDNVTQKRNQEVLLHRMETMAGLTNIAANVAHEIKNPLGAISIHIQLLQKAIKKKREGDGKLPDKKYTENYLDVVTQEIDRLNKIVVNFLMAVRPVAANFSLVRANAILREFIDFITPEFNENNIEVCAELCKEEPKLLIDEKLFREVLVNLAQNALAAIQECFDDNKKVKIFEGAFSGKLSIKTQVTDDRFILKFSDNGCGMSEEVMSRVFEPYYTTKANGTGLGLAMAYKVIKEFSGDIIVESTLGKGSTFTINLPIPQTQHKLLTYKDFRNCGDEK